MNRDKLNFSKAKKVPWLTLIIKVRYILSVLIDGSAHETLNELSRTMNSTASKKSKINIKEK